jgi:hypothetical protein
MANVQDLQRKTAVPTGVSVSVIRAFGFRICFPNDTGQQASACGGVVGFRDSDFGFAFDDGTQG